MESSSEYSAPSERIFIRSEVFEHGYVPETVCFRDEQLAVLADCICGGSGPASHMVLWGPEGTGKTACVRHIFAKITQGSHPGVLPVYLNVMNGTTRPSAAAAMYEALTGTDVPQSSRSFAQVRHNLGKKLQNDKRTMVVCLDDAEWLLKTNEKRTILTDILKIEENYPGAKVCVLVVTSISPPEAVNAFRQSNLMTFFPEVLYFPPYGHKVLLGILEQYASAGLSPEAFPVPVLERIVEYVGDKGDARLSIAMLRGVARSAMREGRDGITDADIISVCHSLMVLGNNAVVTDLDEKNKKILAYIARRTMEGKKVFTGEVYGVAEQETGLKTTTVFRRLKKLELFKFIRLEPVNRGRWGHTTEVVMLVNPVRLVDSEW